MTSNKGPSVAAGSTSEELPEDCLECGGEGTLSEDRWCYKRDTHYTIDRPCPACNEQDEPDWDNMPGGYDYER